MGEKEKQNGTCAVEKGRKESIKMVRSRMMLEPLFQPSNMVAMRSKLMGEVCLSS